MKRKYLLLSLLSLSVLAGCGETSSSLSDSNNSENTATTDNTTSSTTSEKTTSSTVVDNGPDVGDLLGAFSTHKVKVEVEGYIYEFYGDKGFQVTFTSNNQTYTYGAAQTSDGLWSYTREEDTITTESCYTKSNAYKIADFASEYLGADFYSTFDMLDDPYAISWEESDDDENVFLTDDEEIIESILGLYGLTEDYIDSVSYDTEDFELEMTDDDACEITGKFKYGSKKYDVDIVFSSIGTLTDSVFDTYVTDFSKPVYTDYESSFKASLKAFLGFDLPYCSNFTGYIQYGASYDDDGNVEYYGYSDLGCGNQVVAFGALLKELGFDDNDSTQSEGTYYTTATYTKLKTDGGDTAASVYFTIDVAYYSADYFKLIDQYYSSSYADIYTDGLFSFQVTTEESFSTTSLEGANKYIAANIKTSAGAAIVPTISFGDVTLTSLAFEDLTSSYNDYYGSYGLTCNYYYSLEAVCASEEDAVSALSNYFDILFAENSGFVAQVYTSSSSSTATTITLAEAKTKLAEYSVIYATDSTNDIQLAMKLKNTSSSTSGTSSSSAASYNAFYIVIMG